MAKFHILKAITWQDLVRVDATPNANDLKKNDAGAAWNAGARSVETIAAAAYGPPARMSFQAGQANKFLACGLSNSNPDNDVDTIEFGIKLRSDNEIEAIESGVIKYGPTGSYLTTDLFSIEVNASGYLEYKQNGVTFYTSTASPSYPLFVDTSIFQFEAAILDVKLNQEITEITPLEAFPSDRPFNFNQVWQETKGGEVIVSGLAPAQEFVSVLIRTLSTAGKAGLWDFILNYANGAMNKFDLEDDLDVRHLNCRFKTTNFSFPLTHPNVHEEEILIRTNLS